MVVDHGPDLGVGRVVGDEGSLDLHLVDDVPVFLGAVENLLVGYALVSSVNDRTDRVNEPRKASIFSMIWMGKLGSRECCLWTCAIN
jgi:hypothetical protein